MWKAKQRDVLIAAAAQHQYACIDAVAITAGCSRSVACKWLDWAAMNGLFRKLGERPRLYLPRPSFVGEFMASPVEASAQAAFAKYDDIKLWHYLQHAESIAIGLVEWGTYPETKADRWLKRWEMARDELARRDACRVSGYTVI